jgi:hypothetical protein
LTILAPHSSHWPKLPSSIRFSAPSIWSRGVLFVPQQTQREFLIEVATPKLCHVSGHTGGFAVILVQGIVFHLRQVAPQSRPQSEKSLPMKREIRRHHSVGLNVVMSDPESETLFVVTHVCSSKASEVGSTPRAAYTCPSLLNPSGQISIWRLSPYCFSGLRFIQSP